MATATKAKPRLKIQPLEDRVVILPAEEAESMRGGLYIPDTAKEKPTQGEVIAVGPGRFEKGERVPMDLKVGDKVIYGKYSGTPYHGRRRRVRHHQGVRRPRQARLMQLILTRGVKTYGSEGTAVQHRRPRQAQAGRRRPGRGGEGHPRPQGPERRHRQEVRLARPSPRTASPSPRRSS